MKKIFAGSLVLLALLFVYTYADEATTTPETASSTPEVIPEEENEEVPEETPPPAPIEGTIALPDRCEVEDSEDITHVFPQADSPSKFLAICALVVAQEEEVIESFELTNHPSFGLFVESVNGLAAGADEFWALWLNGDFAACGIGCLPLEIEDIMALILTSFEGEERDPGVALHVIALVETPKEEPEETPPTPSPGGGNGSDNDQEFDVPAALAYLASTHEPSDSFITDWVAIAYGVVNGGAAEADVREYLLSADPNLSNVTDYERHAMALMALGINPYSGAGVDYISPIVEAFDGVQIGEEGLVNDDIFALFPLLKAGYSTGDELVQKAVAFIISEQKSNGSWEEGTDMTAAAVQALAEVESLSGVEEALSSAKTYLHSQQESGGGFGDPFATSWVMQAIAALGENPSQWTVDGRDPEEYLAAQQSDDGGMLELSESTDNRVWATAYAIPAALGESWPELLSSFSKPVIQATSDGGGGSNSSASSRQATSTATTTGLVLGEATSTGSTGSQQASSGQATTTASPPPVAPQALAQSHALSSSVPTKPTADTGAATTSSSTNSQLATVAESIGGTSSTWAWLAGLFLIFGALVYFFLRRT